MKFLSPYSLALILLLSGCESSELVDPSTIIRFQVPNESKVRLYVTNSYDVLMATLVDGVLPGGYHSSQFSMKDLPEGLYFYTIEVTETATGKYYKTTRHIVLDK